MKWGMYYTFVTWVLWGIGATAKTEVFYPLLWIVVLLSILYLLYGILLEAGESTHDKQMLELENKHVIDERQLELQIAKEHNAYLRETPPAPPTHTHFPSSYGPSSILLDKDK